MKQIDLGWNAIKKQIIGLNKLEIQTGLFNERLAKIGYWNEYGTKRIPHRPFMRNAFFKNKNNWEKQITKNVFSRIIGNKGKGNIKIITKIIGALIEKDIKNSISNGIYTPNAFSTIARKKSSHPLIDKGTMLRAVTYKIKGV